VSDRHGRRERYTLGNFTAARPSLRQCCCFRRTQAVPSIFSFLLGVTQGSRLLTVHVCTHKSHTHAYLPANIHRPTRACVVKLLYSSVIKHQNNSKTISKRKRCQKFVPLVWGHPPPLDTLVRRIRRLYTCRAPAATCGSPEIHDNLTVPTSRR